MDVRDALLGSIEYTARVTVLVSLGSGSALLLYRNTSNLVLEIF